MKVRNTRPYIVKNYECVKDDEGGNYQGFKDEGFLINAYVYPATDKLQAEIYGERLSNINNVLMNCTIKKVRIENKKQVFYLDNGNKIAAGDGICIYSQNDPDYKVISVKNYGHLKLEIELINNG